MIRETSGLSVLTRGHGRDRPIVRESIPSRTLELSMLRLGHGTSTRWVTPSEEGSQGEKNSRVKGVGAGAEAWAVQGWVTSWVGRRGYLYWLTINFRWSSFVT